jgi:hypothetical protein
LPDWFQDFQLRYHCYHHSRCVMPSFDGDSLIHGFCCDVFAPCGDGLCCWCFGVTCYGHLQDWSFEVFFFKSCLLFLLQMHTPVRVNQVLELDTYISCIHSNVSEHAVAQLVEALRYKSEGRGFDSRWCQ